MTPIIIVFGSQSNLYSFVCNHHVHLEAMHERFLRGAKKNLGPTDPLVGSLPILAELTLAGLHTWSCCAIWRSVILPPTFAEDPLVNSSFFYILESDENNLSIQYPLGRLRLFNLHLSDHHLNRLQQ